MSWEKVVRQDYFQGSDRPFISIANDHISFNTVFTKLAGIEKGDRVTVYVDAGNLRIGFEFHKDEKPDSLLLTRASSAKKDQAGRGVHCASQGILSKYPWIKSIAKLESKDRRFYDPKKESRMWVIQICPAFENRKARETDDIPSNITGIYRYLNENGEIMYIGRGSIKARLKSPEREDWNFDVIEYSEVKDPDMQVKWEGHWIEKYKEKNNGKLPYYNKVSGSEK